MLKLVSDNLLLIEDESIYIYNLKEAAIESVGHVRHTYTQKNRPINNNNSINSSGYIYAPYAPLQISEGNHIHFKKELFKIIYIQKVIGFGGLSLVSEILLKEKIKYIVIDERSSAFFEIFKLYEKLYK